MNGSSARGESLWIARAMSSGLRRRDLLDLVEEALHRRALADHLVLGELLARRGFERAPRLRGLEHVLHADEDALASQRLLEEVARPELDGVDRVVDRRVPADHDDRQVARRLLLADPLEGLEAAHLRQLHVEDAEVDGRERAREDLEAALGALGAEDAVALALQHELERPPDVLLVVDDEDRLGGQGSRLGAHRAARLAHASGDGALRRGTCSASAERPRAGEGSAVIHVEGCRKQPKSLALPGCAYL
jgi:hypothetical protein